MMDCLIQLATALCLISPSQLTLRADVSMQVAGDFSYHVAGRDYGGGHVGRIGLELPVATYRGFRMVAGWEHESLLDTRRDRGQERVYAGFTYRIFGGAR
jgi:hypothetical protein